MTIIADSGALYAIYDAADKHHKDVLRVLKTESDEIIIPMPILSELDYLLTEYLGTEAEIAFLNDIQEGTYTLESCTSSDLIRCQQLMQTYQGLKLGLSDCMVIAAAERFKTKRILTVDQRHFRAVKSTQGPFEILPADLLK